MKNNGKGIDALSDQTENDIVCTMCKWNAEQYGTICSNQHETFQTENIENANISKPPKAPSNPTENRDVHHSPVQLRLIYLVI